MWLREFFFGVRDKIVNCSTWGSVFCLLNTFLLGEVTAGADREGGILSMSTGRPRFDASIIGSNPLAWDTMLSLFFQLHTGDKPGTLTQEVNIFTPVLDIF